MSAKANPTRYDLERKQARQNAQIVAAAIESRKLGFLSDQPGPSPQPQSIAGRPYSGFNAIVAEALAARLNSDSVQFGTASQFRAAGFGVRKGERGVSVVGTATKEFRVVRDECGMPVITKNGRIKRELADLDEPRPDTYVVYHASQVRPIDREAAPELPAPVQTRAAGHPLEMAQELAAQLGAKIRRADTRMTRAAPGGITMPASEAIGNPADEAREIVSGLADWLQESGTLRSGSYDFAWKNPLVKALAAHRVGQELGIGSRTLGFRPEHLQNIARAMRAKPERMVGVALDAGERSDYMCGDAAARDKLRDVSEARARRQAQRRPYARKRSRGRPRRGR